MFDVRRLEDINLNEIDLKSQYYENFINGNIEQANKIINDNPNLKFKVLNADNLNKIVSHIINLENNYYDNVEKVLDKDKTDYQIKVDDLIYLKDYNDNKEYTINNFVLYQENIYFCIKNTKGNLPTNKTYWIYLGLKGEEGYKSLGIHYKGYWNGESNYKKYDMVVYNNNLYVSKQDNKNANPNTSPQWSLQMKVENQGIFVSKAEPKNIKRGNIWIHIL